MMSTLAPGPDHTGRPARSSITPRAAGGRALAVLVAISVCLSGAAPGPTTPIEVEGVAAVVNGDLARARDGAIDDAKRRAVEQVAGTRVDARSISENFQLVEDRIFSRASGFVRTYAIASEAREGDVYRVKIRAEVDSAALVDDLGRLFASRPRIIVLVAEQNAGASSPSFWWGRKGFTSEMDVFQATLIRAWQPRGFKFVDPALLEGKLQAGRALTTPELSTPDALTLSRSADADVALVGKVLVTDAGPVMSGVRMRSFQAIGTIRALRVDTGEVIAVHDAAGVATHIEPNAGGRLAIKALAEKLGAELERQILTQWTAEVASATEIELVVANAKTARVIDELSRVIGGEIRGVEAITVRRRQSGSAFFTVRFRGDALRLAREIEGKKFRDLQVVVDEATQAAVKLTVSGGSP